MMHIAMINRAGGDIKSASEIYGVPVDILQQAQYADYLGVPLFDTKHIGYSDIEIQKLKRLYDWMISANDKDSINRQRYNFGKFFKEHDIRRGTNFKETFPEFAEFYDDCQRIKL